MPDTTPLDPAPPARELVFAYDGSLHGDWVAHYAIRFAASRTPRRLRLVHVAGDPPTALPAQLDRIAAECAVLGVALTAEVVDRGGADVPARLLAVVPPGAIVITGTRARPRARGFLGGTASARLLTAERIGVIALRIVQPGVLGQPNRVLLPVIDGAPVAARVLPLLRLLGADLERLHVAHLRARSALRTRLTSAEGQQRLLATDARHLAAIEQALARGLAPLAPHLDGSLAVTADLAREIALVAARHHARLIALDAAGDAPLERILQLAPADVAIYRGLS